MLKETSRHSTILSPLSSGLLTTQVIAFFQVRYSNLLNYERVKEISDAGFLPVPYGNAAVKLGMWGSALWGGLFYTLTIGAGLTIASWAITSIWKGPLRRSPAFIISAILAWLAAIVWINLGGFTLAGSCYVVLVPGATSLVVIYAPNSSGVRLKWVLAPLIVLTSLWLSQMNSQLFINIRDYLLLSNPVGRTINDFYYSYTMYPAKSFKNFRQQIVRTCHLEKPLKQQSPLGKALIQNDTIPISGKSHSQMLISPSGRKLVLSSPSGKKMEVNARQFISQPLQVIEEFSNLTDNLSNLRQMTFYGLLLGFPILLYLTVFNGVLGFFSNFTVMDRAAPLTALFCLLLGAVLLWPVYTGTHTAATLNSRQIQSALSSSNWQLRLAALRSIAEKRLEIAEFSGLGDIIADRSVAERYWLAKTLGLSQSSETLKTLYRMIDDPHPNVVCQVLASLAARNDKNAINLIYRKLTTTGHWYIQWYAYNALRRLGWKQGKSTRPA